MALGTDPRYRHGLASCLAGIAAVLLGVALELFGLTIASSGYAAGLGFIGLLVAMSGTGAAVLGAVDMERSVGPARD